MSSTWVADATSFVDRGNSESGLADSEFELGPFRLWCDDFRPVDFMVDKNYKITPVIDWEFTYAAPVKFSFIPPW